MMMATDARRGWVGGDWMRRVGKARREWIRERSAVDGVSVGVEATMLSICLRQFVDISREGAVYKSRYPPEKHTRIEDIPITNPLNEYLLGKYTTPPPAWVANRSPIIT